MPTTVAGLGVARTTLEVMLRSLTMVVLMRMLIVIVTLPPPPPMAMHPFLHPPLLPPPSPTSTVQHHKKNQLRHPDQYSSHNAANLQPPDPIDHRLTVPRQHDRQITMNNAVAIAAAIAVAMWRRITTPKPNETIHPRKGQEGSQRGEDHNRQRQLRVEFC